MAARSEPRKPVSDARTRASLETEGAREALALACAGDKAPRFTSPRHQCAASRSRERPFCRQCGRPDKDIVDKSHFVVDKETFEPAAGPLFPPFLTFDGDGLPWFAHRETKEVRSLLEVSDKKRSDVLPAPKVSRAHGSRRSLTAGLMLLRTGSWPVLAVRAPGCVSCARPGACRARALPWIARALPGFART